MFFKQKLPLAESNNLSVNIFKLVDCLGAENFFTRESATDRLTSILSRRALALAPFEDFGDHQEVKDFLTRSDYHLSKANLDFEIVHRLKRISQRADISIGLTTFVILSENPITIASRVRELGSRILTGPSLRAPLSTMWQRNTRAMLAELNREGMSRRDRFDITWIADGLLERFGFARVDATLREIRHGATAQVFQLSLAKSPTDVPRIFFQTQASLRFEDVLARSSLVTLFLLDDISLAALSGAPSDYDVFVADGALLQFEVNTPKTASLDSYRLSNAADAPTVWLFTSFQQPIPPYVLQQLLFRTTFRGLTGGRTALQSVFDAYDAFARAQLAAE